MNMPNCIKSSKSKLLFTSITSILCRMKANHPIHDCQQFKLLNKLYHAPMPNTSLVWGMV